MHKILVKSDPKFFSGHWYIISGELKKMYGKWCQDRNSGVIYVIDDINDYGANHINKKCGMSYARKNCDMIVATNNIRIQSLRIDNELEAYIKLGGTDMLSEIKIYQGDDSWMACHNYKFELNWTTKELEAYKTSQSSKHRLNTV